VPELGRVNDCLGVINMPTQWLCHNLPPLSAMTTPNPLVRTLAWAGVHIPDALEDGNHRRLLGQLWAWSLHCMSVSLAMPTAILLKAFMGQRALTWLSYWHSNRFFKGTCYDRHISTLAPSPIKMEVQCTRPWVQLPALPKKKKKREVQQCNIETGNSGEYIAINRHWSYQMFSVLPGGTIRKGRQARPVGSYLWFQNSEGWGRRI
jgi:hypothetical protein